MFPTRGFLVLGCALSLSAGSPPPWVKGNGADPETLPPARYLTGYGLSERGPSLAEQRRQAVAMAREALVSTIRVRISSDFESRVTQDGERMARFTQNRTRARADLELDGLDRCEVWPDPKAQVTHALAILDKPRTLQLLSGRMVIQAQACRALFERGCQSGDPAPLLQARQLRTRMEEGLAIAAVLGAPLSPDPAPAAAAIDQELRQSYDRQPGLDGPVALAALELEDRLPRDLRLAMDRITFGDTGHCGSFSAAWIQALAAQLGAMGRIQVLDRTAEAQAAQGLLRGSCFQLGDQIHVQMRVTASDGTELAATSLAFPATRLAQTGLSLAPPPLAGAAGGTLEVRAAVDRGAGGVYRAGDRLRLSLQANQDCYVKVIYQQADGRRLLIFPNRFHPDSRIRRDCSYPIPPADHRFEFVVAEPFGVERIQVIACTEPIDLHGLHPDRNGLGEVTESLSALLGRTRGILARKPEALYAEDSVVVNTMR